MRIALLFLVVVGCGHGLARNEVVGKTSAVHVVWKAKVGTATFCRACGGGPLVKVELGSPAKVVLAIPSCYAHAKSRIGDHDAIKVERVDGHMPAKDAELDIGDCSTTHLTASLWATWPDGFRIDAKIDTDLAHAE
jgi:hypothetical protein